MRLAAVNVGRIEKKYNDNIDVNNFQYFTRGGASSEMRLKIIDVDIVFIANWSYSL